MTWTTENLHRLFKRKLVIRSAVLMYDWGCAAGERDLASPVCMIMDYSCCRCCNEPSPRPPVCLQRAKHWPTSAAQVAHADAGLCLDGGGQQWPPDIQTTHSTPRSNVSTRAAAAEKRIVTFDCESLLASCILFHHPSLKWFVCMCGLEKTSIGWQIMTELITSNSSESVSMKSDSSVRIFQSFDRPQLFDDLM